VTPSRHHSLEMCIWNLPAKRNIHLLQYCMCIKGLLCVKLIMLLAGSLLK